MWLKLDNAAKIYPPTRTRNWAAMFRLSVSLNEPVDVEVLETAQKNILKRFPSFSVRLKRGLFWFYLEQIDGAPPIQEDQYVPLQKLWDLRHDPFLYRLLVSGNRIAVEIFHVLADGSGGMTFLLSLTAEYLRLKHGCTVETGQYILSTAEEPVPEEYEDSFLRYAGKRSISRSEQVSYHVGGTSVPMNKLLIISGTVPTQELVEKARSYQVSVGIFLAAVLLYAVHQKQRAEKKRRLKDRPVKISIPVNLRRYFPSKTLRNFSSYINPGIEGCFGEYSFEEILETIRHYAGLHLNKKELQAKFTSNVMSEKNPVLRPVPLFIKNPILRFVYFLRGDRYFASTISNLGQITLPETIAAQVGRIDFLLGRSTSKRSNCACVSFGGTTIINFSRNTVEAEVERYFFTTLVKMGIHVRIESNGRT